MTVKLKSKKCPDCGRKVRVRADGTMSRHYEPSQIGLKLRCNPKPARIFQAAKRLIEEPGRWNQHTPDPLNKAAQPPFMESYSAKPQKQGAAQPPYTLSVTDQLVTRLVSLMKFAALNQIPMLTVWEKAVQEASKEEQPSWTENIA